MKAIRIHLDFSIERATTVAIEKYKKTVEEKRRNKKSLLLSFFLSFFLIPLRFGWLKEKKQKEKRRNEKSRKRKIESKKNQIQIADNKKRCRKPTRLNRKRMEKE